MRPRYVVVLCAAAVALAAVELAVALWPGGSPPWRGLAGGHLHGTAARVAAAADAFVCVVLAAGLWQLRAWARLAAMGYLGVLLASFLFFGAGDDRLSRVMGWQVAVLPFATFCLMYLYNGARHFD